METQMERERRATAELEVPNVVFEGSILISACLPLLGSSLQEGLRHSQVLGVHRKLLGSTEKAVFHTSRVGRRNGLGRSWQGRERNQEEWALLLSY